MAILTSPELIQAIRRYKAGEQAAFDEIYHGSVRYVTKCVLTVLGRTAPEASEDLQQDIIQETYLTIATKLDTLHSEEAFLQWAGQIATNHALRTWQRDVRRQEQEQPEEEQLYELPDERFIPEDILENKEKQQLIRKMLQELPTNQYLCLVEYFYNGLKERQIAEKLDMPLGTVKTNLSRAKKKLKQIVQTHEKKSGVKLYSMSWLLLLLFWQDIKAMFLDEKTTAATLKDLQGALGVDGAGGVAAGTGTAAAGTGATGGTLTAMGLKIAAAVVAAAVAIGGIALALTDSREEPVPTTEATVSNEETATTTQVTETTAAPTETEPVAALTQEQEENLERILLYTAFVDSGVIDGQVAQNWGAWLEDQELEKFPFLTLTEPVPGAWDKCQVLLLMGWNQEAALDVRYDSDRWCGAAPGAYCYPLDTAQALMTDMFGSFDSSYLDGNVFMRGYYTELINGMVCQPSTHLYPERYGQLTLKHVEALGEGKLAIYAEYERDFVLNCVYYADEKPESYMGCTLTGVNYTFAE